MSRKKINRRVKDHNDMLTKAKRASRSRARISIAQQVAEALDAEYGDFYDIWYGWDDWELYDW
jgi:hypothetical protein